MSGQPKEVRRVRCQVKGCRFVSAPARYDVRWAQWSAHYLEVHYDPRWDVECPRDGCEWSSRAATVLDHHRAQTVHAANDHGANR